MDKLEYIFVDLDGTLINGKSKHYHCYSDIVLKHEGQPLYIDDYWKMKRQKIGNGEILEKSKYTYSYNAFMTEWLKNIEEPEYLQYDILNPNVIEILKKWKQYSEKIILVTMRNNEVNLNIQLKQLKLRELFDEVVVCKKENGLEKYDFVKTYKFSKAIVIGDTEDDIKLSKKLNAKSIMVTSGIRDKELIEADFYVDQVENIDFDKILLEL